MGIHDRDYSGGGGGLFGRGGGGGGMFGGGMSGGGMPGRGFGGGPRMWSVTTWLIVICVSVFVVDTFLPKVEVALDQRVDPQFVELVKSGQAEELETEVVRRRGNQPLTGRRLLIAEVDGQPTPVGEVEVRFMHPIEASMHYSTLRFFKIEFWRFIGFQFLHSHETIFHLVFNMVGLFFFGPIVEQALGRKRYLAFYLLCGICGALMYTLLNVLGLAVLASGSSNPVPFLLFSDIGTPLIGASAGVFGVLMAGAKLAPNVRVLVMFVIPMRLSTVAYILVGLAVITLFRQGNNAGGEAAHLGGAIAGFYFIRHPHHLHDFFDILGRVDPTSDRYVGRRSGGRASKGDGGERRFRVPRPGRNVPDTAEVDRILDKVRAEGIASLTPAEQKTLHRASESMEDGR